MELVLVGLGLPAVVRDNHDGRIDKGGVFRLVVCLDLIGFRADACGPGVLNGFHDSIDSRRPGSQTEHCKKRRVDEQGYVSTSVPAGIGLLVAQQLAYEPSDIDHEDYFVRHECDRRTSSLP